MVELSWHYQEKEPMEIRQFLRQVDLPRRFVKSIKMQGEILLNQQAVTVRARLHQGDYLVLVAPDEPAYEQVAVSHYPITIVYEDEDVLVLNKPAGVVSIPSKYDPDTSIANRVKGYYVRQGYRDQVVHVVTRLDKMTTGLMIIARHRLAHALLDKQIRAHKVQKFYQAISSRIDWPSHGLIDAPIARCGDSIITRQVDSRGQVARTEYWVEKTFKDSSLLRIQLHTGRTHQIRVHMQYAQGPLIGDDLYGGPIIPPLDRQALHCHELIFNHPLTGQMIHLQEEMPQDMMDWVINRQRSI